MPYSGRLPAIFLGKPVLIVGFDATHALCINGEGRLVYIEHKDLEIPLHGDAEGVYWMESGYEVSEAAADSSDLGDEPYESGDDLSNAR